MCITNYLDILSLETTFKVRWMSSLLTWLHRYSATSINDNNTCSDDSRSKKDTIICWANIGQLFHSFCYWDVWMFSFLFWFIFYRLCIDHYCASSTIFFSSLDACFLLSTTCVHNPITCASHNNFSTSYYTWMRFLISSTHHT